MCLLIYLDEIYLILFIYYRGQRQNDFISRQPRSYLDENTDHFSVIRL